MRVFSGTLLSSVKKIKAPYVFDWEDGIALHSCRGFVSHLSDRGKSHGFSEIAAGTWGYILELRWGWPFKTRVS